MSYRPTRSIVAALHHAAASLFLPVRRLAGPFHRGRPALSDEQVEKEHALPPLPRPWSLDDRWYRGDFPPRMHNDVCALIHGHEYFADLVGELRSARRRVTIVGWTLTPLMALERRWDQAVSVLAEVLRDVSTNADDCMLLWSGAAALFEPTVHLQRSCGASCWLSRRGYSANWTGAPVSAMTTTRKQSPSTGELRTSVVWICALSRGTDGIPRTTNFASAPTGTMCRFSCAARW